MSRATVQVFEHSTIRVGERLRTANGGEHELTAAQHHVLTVFADETRDRYFACGRRTVRFGSYVGLLSLGDLCIEILPKADRTEVGGHGRWHRALVQMLRVAGDLGLEAQDEADLRVDPGRLFDLFIARFLDECERLLHEGLSKGYRTEEENRTAFRGRLVVARHIRENVVNAARFYVASPVYDHRNVPNLALHEALCIVEQLPLSDFVRARARSLRKGFPELPRWTPAPGVLERLRLRRNTERYRNALRLARLILFHLTPSMRHGQTPLLALLFDMNDLWERYVAALARRLRLPGLDVRAQDSARFWRAPPASSRVLTPDITLRERATRRTVLLIDTKWKLPKDGQPSTADLKQMFCYHELFGCSRSMLLYPSPSAATHVGTVGRYADRSHECSLVFLAIDGDTRTGLERVTREGLGDGGEQ